VAGVVVGGGAPGGPLLRLPLAPNTPTPLPAGGGAAQQQVPTMQRHRLRLCAWWWSETGENKSE